MSRVAMGFVSLFLLTGAGVAKTVKAETPEETMSRAQKKFSRGEWEAASRLLRIAAPRLKVPKQRGVAYKTLGLAQTELKRRVDAEAAFVQALTADPTVEIDPVEDTPVAVTLFRTVRDRLDGQLIVTTDHNDARLFVDGVNEGAVPFAGRVKIGKRRVRVATGDGEFARDLDSVVIHVGRTTILAVKLERRVAFLVVRGAPGAQVFVDAKPAGQSPLARTGVVPGRRVIEIKRDGYQSKRFDEHFAPGEEKIVDGTLVPLRKDNRVRTTDTPESLTTAAPKERKTRKWGILMLGVGIATLVAGSLMYGLPSAPSALGVPRDDYTRELSRFNGWVDAGLGVMIAGGGLLLASGALFALHRDGAVAIKPAQHLTTRGKGISFAFSF